MYVTSSTLDGECKELKAEDGDEDQSRQLSACAAWVQDQEEDAGELEDFVMAQVGNRYRCTINLPLTANFRDEAERLMIRSSEFGDNNVL